MSNGVGWVSLIEKIIVVEKDTVFQRVLEVYKDDDTVMVVTGKGYPDYATRKFLEEIVRIGNINLKMVYIGDADPHGADIYFTYFFGSF